MKRSRLLTVALATVALLLGGLGAAGAAPKDKAPVEQEDRGGPKASSCEDGEDNDGDGLLDAGDPDCQQPGCQPSSRTPTKCSEVHDDSTGGEDPVPGNCEDEADNDDDELIDADDPDCQGEDCTVEDVNTCNEENDDSTSGDAACTEEAGEAGLVGDPVGKQLFDGGLDVSPLFEDPQGNGVVSGAVKDGGKGTPLEPVTTELGCTIDLFLDEGTSPLDP